MMIESNQVTSDGNTCSIKRHTERVKLVILVIIKWNKWIQRRNLHQRVKCLFSILFWSQRSQEERKEGKRCFFSVATGIKRCLFKGRRSDLWCFFLRASVSLHCFLTSKPSAAEAVIVFVDQRLVIILLIFFSLPFDSQVQQKISNARQIRTFLLLLLLFLPLTTVPLICLLFCWYVLLLFCVPLNSRHWEFTTIFYVGLAIFLCVCVVLMNVREWKNGSWECVSDSVCCLYVICVWL